jgi:chitinase
MRQDTFRCTPPSVFLTILCIFLQSHTMLQAQPCREIVGYYPAWKWFAREQLVSPQNIKYDRYSVINYAFFKPLPDGRLKGTDDWADENLLQGKINWETSPKSHYPNTSIVDLAHNAGVKIVISIGGWSESDLFPSIASDAQKRQTFASECARLSAFYNLDGIDIDWEYPGYAEHKGTPADKQNFTFLLRGIRDSLSGLSKQTGKNYLLTGAFGAGGDHFDNIEWENIAPLMDAINLMTYDFYGTWASETGHHAALFAASEKDKRANADVYGKLLIEKYMVPPSKINIGVAFYGLSFKTKGDPALYAPSLKKRDEETFKNGENYHEIDSILKTNTFTEHWDDKAQAPFLTGNGGLNTFVSYENARSVSAKAQYVLDKNLRGVIVWELTGDYLKNTDLSRNNLEGGISTPLVDAIHTVFCTSSPQIKITDTSEKKTSRPSNPIVSILATEEPKKDLPVDTVEMPTDKIAITDDKTKEKSLEKPAKPDKEEELFNETLPHTGDLVNDFDAFTDDNGFLILKFYLKQRANMCLKMLSENGQIRRDIDLGEIGEGLYEHWATTHKDLPSGKYKVWVDACESVVAPKKAFKEWVKL